MAQDPVAKQREFRQLDPRPLQQHWSEVPASKPLWATRVDGITHTLQSIDSPGGRHCAGAGVEVTVGGGVVWVVQVDGVGSAF